MLAATAVGGSSHERISASSEAVQRDRDGEQGEWEIGFWKRKTVYAEKSDEHDKAIQNRKDTDADSKEKRDPAHKFGKSGSVGKQHRKGETESGDGRGKGLHAARRGSSEKFPIPVIDKNAANGDT